jgi:hypothetical protein
MRTETRSESPEHVQLRTRLEELRLKLHLGGMEAKEKFEELSREVSALGRKAAHASKTATRKLQDRIDAFEAALLFPD